MAPDVWKTDLKQLANSFLESENAAYRIVGDIVTPISDEYEVESVETALEKGITAVRSHLLRALELMSDRKEPDYRNSIKESISAVESACQVISGKPSATLGDCIKAIKARGSMHPAFEQALGNLYGYTSNQGGIRHALTEEKTEPSFADAKFMLAVCATFTNYLWTKAAEASIPISES